MKTQMVRVALAIMTCAATASATSQGYSGHVQWLMVDDGTNAGPGAGIYTGQVFMLDATASSTTCKTEPAAGGKTYVRLPDTSAGDKMRQVVTSAYLAGKLLYVTVNDASKDSLGVCYAKGVRMQG